MSLEERRISGRPPLKKGARHYGWKGGCIHEASFTVMMNGGLYPRNAAMEVGAARFAGLTDEEIRAVSTESTQSRSTG